MLTIKKILAMPYVTDLDLPIHWRDDKSGLVSGPIMAYIRHCADPARYPAPTPAQLRTAAEYLQYFINAPCWERTGGFTEELAALRARIAGIVAGETIELEAVKVWVFDCLEIAVNPL